MIDSDLIAEVQAWIALDPDPKTAAVLQGWLDAGNELELRKSFSVFLNLEQRAYAARCALALQE